MNKQLLMAINQICAERNLRPQVVIEAVEQALVSAYRRNFGGGGNVQAKLDPETGDMHIYTRYEVVEDGEVVDPKTQISLEKAREIDPEVEVGGEILVETIPDDFGRIAAQTAKQVILQRIREAERDSIYEDYSERVGELIQGVVRSVDHSNGSLIISLDGGRAEGIMHRSDQIPGERPRVNSSILAYISDVTRSPRGPVIHLSRSHRNMLRRLLEKEVPEIKQGAVEIKAIAREAGSRSKIAVTATQPGVDPVGSCVGMRGVRIQNIVNELNGEKIDVIEWDPDGERFVANALSPARVTDVLLFPEHDKTAMVVVPDNQLSLAIGKEGQNARLVAKLTGWRIDIKSESEANAEGLDELERQRLRAARKERAHAEDLLEAAKRILEEEEPALLLDTEEPLLETSLLDDMDELGIPLLDDEVPVVDLDDVAPELDEAAAELSEEAVAQEAEPAQEEDQEALDLAAKLREAMTSADEGYDFDESSFARVFGEEDEEEEEESKSAKKKRRKDRKLVFDEEQGRLVAVKKRKRTRGGGKFDLDSMDYDLDDFEDF
ncbi:MAG: transcription termination/antitermination protein NusA [Chloroflexi bacterium]|nr:MAG: transcription termination/antitermination protein NusA [Chloroflexota bacterium]